MSHNSADIEYVSSIRMSEIQISHATYIIIGEI